MKLHHINSNNLTCTAVGYFTERVNALDAIFAWLVSILSSRAQNLAIWLKNRFCRSSNLIGWMRWISYYLIFALLSRMSKLLLSFLCLINGLISIHYDAQNTIFVCSNLICLLFWRLCVSNHAFLICYIYLIFTVNVFIII